MTDRAPVGALDGIAVLELSIDDREAHDVVAAILMGANAWELAPAADTVDQALRPRRVERLRRIAIELANEVADTHVRREQAHRERNKAESKQ